MSKVIIRRPEEWTGAFAKCLIYIDGIESGDVSVGETAEIPLSAGNHTLKIKTKLRLAGSPLINFNINENETKEFEVKSNPKEMRFGIIPFLLAIVYLIMQHTLSATITNIYLSFAILFIILLVYIRIDKNISLTELQAL